VYAARDEHLDRTVAIKVIAIGAGRTRTHVLREARALAAVCHPNVVEVFDVVADREHVGIVMQRLAGCSLRTYLEQPRSRVELVRLFVAVGRGLAAAHARGVCHRDVKPANVIVDCEGHPHLVDFGLAALMTPGTPVGTPAYAAPELLRGEPSDASADQYSFCVALHEALIGVRPTSANAVATSLPWRWRRAIERGLAEDPAQRHPSMDALLAELRFVPRLRLALVGVALCGAVAWASLARDRECPADGLERTGVWTDDRWRAVTNAFMASGADLEVVGDALVRIEPMLHDYAGAWTAARTATCTADGTADEAKLSCLGRTRARLDALLRRFEAADATVVGRATRAVMSLPAPSGCVEQSEPIADMTTRIALDDARTAYDLGRFADALATARAIAVSGSDREDEPAVAEARWIEGLALSDLGDTELAIEALSDAYWACERLGLDDVGVRAAASLVGIVGADRGDLAGAEQWYRHASARIARGGVDPAAQGQLLVNWGTALYVSGRADLALAVQLEAIALFEASLGSDHPFLAAAHSAASSSLIALSRHEEALDRQEVALAIQLRVLGPSHPSTAASQQNLGTALLGLGRYDAAEPLLVEAIATFARQLGSEHPTVALAEMTLATVHSDQGRFAEAIAAFERAWTALVAAHSPLALRAEHGLAIALMRSGRFDRASQHQRHVVERYTAERGASRPETLRARFNLAELLLVSGDPIAARGVAETAWAELDLEGSRELLGLEAARIMGLVAIASGERERGVEHLERALESSELSPLMRGDAEYALARAIAADDPQRARDLALAASTRLRPFGSRSDEIDTWLVQR
jgi:tetratricopeptide (TPR) repeat protein